MAPHIRDAAKKELATHGVAKPRAIINVSSVAGTHGGKCSISFLDARGCAGCWPDILRNEFTHRIVNWMAQHVDGGWHHVVPRDHHV